MSYKNQKEMFNDIWENRTHVSEISNLPLLPKNNFKWHWQFAHILPKGSYPKFKLNPKNIMLMTFLEHRNQESFELFQQRKQELKREYYEKYYNKIY